MLESVFLIIMLMGFVLFLLGIVEENSIFTGTSILMWIIILAAHLYIEVPADTSYEEPVMVPLSLAFIIINLLILVIGYFRMKHEDKYHLR